MDDSDSDRRRFLAFAGTTAVVAASGCLGGSADANHPTTATETSAANTTSETTTEEEPTDPSMSTVFHFSDTQSAQKHAVANVANLLNDDSVSLGDVGLVANGSGIRLLVEGESAKADDVRALIDRGVTFYACHNSMEAFGFTESDLIASEIEVVPAGVGALAKLQAKENYAYIKTP